ncbi:MAG TPA: hypothetical protein VE133_09815, partial [Candidatus Sulfotelmatobacter sp.]|nr:hypothetical protein [Candidatus Sulfotelmatobacter sp.]
MQPRHVDAPAFMAGEPQPQRQAARWRLNRYAAFRRADDFFRALAAVLACCESALWDAADR